MSSKQMTDLLTVITPMVDLGTYIFKDLETEKISPEVLFMNSYTE